MPVFILFSCIYLFFTVFIHFDTQEFISIVKISLLQASIHNYQFLFQIIALEVNLIFLAVI
jgi:hypothetical protein